MARSKKEDALKYHSEGKPGKIEVIPTKPYSTQYDLSLAYSPGVAEPCLEIEKDQANAYKYTSKGNLVAVISNGTAVLGLGDIGALAGKPVMEGKGLLFKIFADIDVFDIEVDQKEVDTFVETVKAIAPTFGGINLEDIKAPECFEIEGRLKKELDIPVMHDDQHGTAIISSAGLLNALELNGKKISEIKIVVSGAGASAVSCTRLYKMLGAKAKNIIMLDSKGVINKKRTGLNKIKKEFVNDTEVETLEEAMKGADMFLGLSTGNIVSQEMVRSMAKDPIVFALANPNPEIGYDEATAARDDIIMATGRSDFPNQVNNVLGFPFIFRGALDVKAKAINEEMKAAAVKALADLAKKTVPDTVNRAYNDSNLIFGPGYIIPKPLDPRLISEVAPAVAKAAMDSGVARAKITDWDAYKTELNRRMGIENQLIHKIRQKAKANPKRVVFAEGDSLRVLKAAQIVKEEGMAEPVLLGSVNAIKRMINENKLDMDGVQIINPKRPEEEARRKEFAQLYYQKRQRKGITCGTAIERMNQRDYYGIMMVETGMADAYISGFSTKYAENIRPALEIVGTKPEIDRIAGMYILMTKKGPLFLADTTVNIRPKPEELVEITLLAAAEIRKLNIEPKIAMVSYSNFGGQKDGSPKRVRDAVAILHRDYPDMIVDGEMQANFALNMALRKDRFPFTKLCGHDVNTLIFPNLSSGNIAYKLLQEVGYAEAIGPILLGIGKPIHILQMGSSVREIVNMANIAVVDAQTTREEIK